MLERVFSENFNIEQIDASANPNTELMSSCMQLLDDLEATYREKRGVGFQRYVANLPERCDPENNLQMISKLQLVPSNITMTIKCWLMLC